MNRDAEPNRDGRYFYKRSQGKPAFGVICCLDGYASSHLVGACGYDFVLIDRQHAAYSWPDLENMCYRIKATGASPFVRTAGDSLEEIDLTLDMPLAGIIIPNIDGVERAERALRLAAFPPEGTRTIGNVRTGAIEGFDYRNAPSPLVGLLIEGIGAIEEIDEIMALDGLDLVFVGPHDLAGSMGLDPRTEPSQPPELAEAISRVRASAESHDVPYWTAGATPELAAAELSAGAAAIMCGIDAAILKGAYEDFLEEVHGGATSPG